MIPYVQVPDLDLGFITLSAFAICVYLGVVLGVRTGLRETARRGLDVGVIRGSLPWLLVPGFVASHLVAVGLYRPEQVAADPLQWLNVLGAMSALGGFLGASVGAIAWLIRSRVELWRYADVMVYGFAHGWIPGRLGCAIVHDHPGIRSDAWYAVRFPDGPRLDLGLLELVWTVLFVAVLRWNRDRTEPAGWMVVAFAVVMGGFRILTDPLRIGERTLGTLHPGAILSGVMILWAVGVAARRRWMRAA